MQYLRLLDYLLLQSTLVHTQKHHMAKINNINNITATFY